MYIFATSSYSPKTKKKKKEDGGVEIPSRGGGGVLRQLIPTFGSRGMGWFAGDPLPHDPP
jgi:hypothetical protein